MQGIKAHQHQNDWGEGDWALSPLQLAQASEAAMQFQMMTAAGMIPPNAKIDHNAMSIMMKAQQQQMMNAGMFLPYPGMVPGMIPPYPGMLPGMAPGMVPGMGPAWPPPASAAPVMSSAGYPGVPPPENVEGSRAKAKAKAKGKKSRGEDAGKAEEGSDKEKETEEDLENDRKAAEDLLARFGTDPVGATASFVTMAFENTRSSKADQKLIASVASKHNCKLFTYTTEQHKTQPLSKSIVEKEAKAKFPNADAAELERAIANGIAVKGSDGRNILEGNELDDEKLRNIHANKFPLTVELEALQCFARSMKEKVLDATKDKNANHVLQKIVEHCPYQTRSFLAEGLQGQGKEFAEHAFGCRVLCRIAEHLNCQDKASMDLFAEVVKSAKDLCHHQYGSFVMRACFNLGNGEDLGFYKVIQVRIIEAMLEGDPPYVTKCVVERLGSYVVEEAIRVAETDEAIQLSYKLLHTYGTSGLKDYCTSRYGRRVFESMLNGQLRSGETATKIKELAFSKLKPLAEEIKDIKYGKPVYNAIQDVEAANSGTIPQSS